VSVNYTFSRCPPTKFAKCSGSLRVSQAVPINYFPDPPPRLKRGDDPGHGGSDSDPVDRSRKAESDTKKEIKDPIVSRVVVVVVGAISRVRGLYIAMPGRP
jgi:hypothetical protein